VAENVMLRITRINNHGHETLRVEGKLKGVWVGELQSAWAKVNGRSDPVYLDLADMSFVDAAGIRLLQSLMEQGAVLSACSGFVAELLDVRKSP
jgi:ABC-type transporter Mla MlaB component